MLLLEHDCLLLLQQGLELLGGQNLLLEDLLHLLGGDHLRTHHGHRHLQRRLFVVVLWGRRAAAGPLEEELSGCL